MYFILVFLGFVIGNFGDQAYNERDWREAVFRTALQAIPIGALYFFTGSN